jgi:hypothetical protein
MNSTENPQKTNNKFPQEKKNFQFDLKVIPKDLRNILYDRDISATWEVAKQQILDSISKFLQERGRTYDEVEMSRIGAILETADEKFKDPDGNLDEYPSGSLTYGMDKLQQAIAEELNNRE